MEPDKRRFARKRTDQLLYAELGPDNGSILLNLCEGGCSFQSIAPVRGESVRFAVSVGDGRKLEGDGHMVWSDTAKKTGGLRFVNPSQELQEQVREWLSRTLVMADGKLDPAAVEAQAKRRRKQLREEARLEAERAKAQADRKATEAANEEKERVATVPVSVPVAMPERAVLSGADDFGRSGRYEGSGRTWLGLGTLAFVALLFLGLITYRRELGHLAMWFGSSLAGEEQRDDVKSAPADAPAQTDAGVNEAKPAPAAEANVSGSSPQATPASDNQVVQPVAQQTQLPKRSAIPGGSSAEDVAALWGAVENGDTQAEVALANRYLHGDGVPQSCAQARVLLEAAAKRGSAEGQQRLEQLPASCR